MRLTVVLDEQGKAARDAAGWEACLDGLAGELRGDPPRGPAGGAAWERYYARYQELGLPASAEIPTPHAG